MEGSQTIWRDLSTNVIWVMKNSTPGRCYFYTPWSWISSNCKWGDNQKCRRNQHENRPRKDCNSKMWLVAKSQLIQNLCGHWHGNTRGIMPMRDYREILSVTTMHLEATHHQMTGCKLVRAAAHGASDPSPSIMNSTDELLPWLLQLKHHTPLVLQYRSFNMAAPALSVKVQ